MDMTERTTLLQTQKKSWTHGLQPYVVCCI